MISPFTLFTYSYKLKLPQALDTYMSFAFSPPLLGWTCIFLTETAITTLNSICYYINNLTCFPMEPVIITWYLMHSIRVYLYSVLFYLNLTINKKFFSPRKCFYSVLTSTCPDNLSEQNSVVFKNQNLVLIDE